ncbi:hypothetical protein [Bacillus xiapuensis]|uniref:Uncharacterized protein n=1 Tax=Bacillus xiapuensis TaxID=2014075 RepID=A0ABU6N4M2_9BACI|nr:hypothetical protein [Bacillus xiapuensis]
MMKLSLIIKHLEQDEPDGYPDEGMMFQVGISIMNTAKKKKVEQYLEKFKMVFIIFKKDIRLNQEKLFYKCSSTFLSQP